MVVERQGPSECGLATIAALAGRTLAEVRQVALEEERRTGRQFFWNTVLNQIALRVGGERLAALCAFHREWRLPDATGEKVRHLGNRLRRLPAQGRGVVRLKSRTRRLGHICPWQDGLIYDPEHPDQPLTLAEYRARNPRWKVDYITLDVAHNL